MTTLDSTNVSRPTYPDLVNKTVFITGGGSGIGAAFTRQFAQQGARVAFVDIAEEASQALVRNVEKETGNAPRFVACDVCDIPALQTAIEKISSELGDIAVLINNASNDARDAFEAVTHSYWDNRVAVNLRHMFFASQAVAYQMKRLGGGAMINLSSIIWRLKLTGTPVYSACKAAVIGLTRTQAREYGAFGIRVNSISPGAVWTERQIKLWFTPEFERDVMAGQCLNARVLPEDIANMALFLASDAASKCTAQDFTVDAGWS
jgi:NAD(P)-dependent dehydrogenase (short-subunit alcohol dehydrogenase family)